MLMSTWMQAIDNETALDEAPVVRLISASDSISFDAQTKLKPTIDELWKCRKHSRQWVYRLHFCKDVDEYQLDTWRRGGPPFHSCCQ